MKHGRSLMMTFAAAAMAGGLAASCSDDETTQNPDLKNRFPDATVGADVVIINPGTDVGGFPLDAGGDCSSNPSGCAPREILGAFPGCECTGTCENGFVYNQETRMCDPASVPDAGVDAGFAPPDSGVPADAGSNAECLVDSNCPGGADARCLNAMTGAQCAGEADCACFLACEWAVPVNQSGCPAGEACAELNLPTAEAVCLPDLGGGLHAQACTATYMGGQIQTDTCNNTRNIFCLGTTPAEPTGICSRLCDASNDRVCASLGNYECAAIPNDPNNRGFCLGRIPTFTDLGRNCPPAQCQSGLCSSDLGGICSSSCGGLNACPNGAICVTAPTEGPICAVECTPGSAGNTACAAVNSDLTCFDLGGGVGICAPL